MSKISVELDEKVLEEAMRLTTLKQKNRSSIMPLKTLLKD